MSVDDNLVSGGGLFSQTGGGIYNGGSRHGIFTGPVAGSERTSRNSTKQAAQVNLIRSSAFKNTPDN